MSEPRKDEPEQKPPGYGVDRTLIQSMLAMTPAERAQAVLQSARNMTAIHEYMRRRK